MTTFLCAALALLGCGTTDPILRQAIAQVERQPTAARTALRPFAEQGNEMAITQICIAYGRSMDSSVLNPERQKAFTWCQHAADAGHVEAQYFLGRFHQWAIGTPENREQALRWFTLAAGRGHADAEDAKRGLEGKSAVCRNWITACRMF